MLKKAEGEKTMSLPKNIEEKCFLCGKTSEQTILLSTNAFGSPDLDLRPPEMARSTMYWWIQECPHCGYISKNLSQKVKSASELLKLIENDNYLSCDGIVFASELAEKFYKYYLINVVKKDYDAAFNAVLHAAWACDDARDTENAINCRKKALIEIDKIISSKNEDLLTIRADLLRRSRQFDLLISEYTKKTFSKDLLNKIIAFEIEKSKENDDSCYKVSDAT